METRDIIRRFRLPLGITVAVVLYGTLGYTIIIPDATPLDGLYWTILTLGGVGYRDTETVGVGAELFSISLILGLLMVVIAAAAIGSELIASGELAHARRRQRMRKKIGALEGHFILCGFGRVGHVVVGEYRRAGVEVIVIEIDHGAVEELDELNVPYLIADPQHDGVLEEAGVHRARGIICAVDSDAINAFIALSARTLNPDLVVVARAADPDSVAKLARVGVDHVVSPYTLTGHRMAADSLLPRGAPSPGAGLP